MTVGELIEELAKLPRDEPIGVVDQVGEEHLLLALEFNAEVDVDRFHVLLFAN